jgi:serine/threonine protein kinase
MVDELQPGMMVRRYRLERQLAKGGMGTVWAARDEGLDRVVVLKLLPRVLVTEPSAERRFEREARAMARLHHANVVSVFDVGTADPGIGKELPFLVMELINGRSLREILEEGAIPPRLAARVVEQVALALTAAHSAGVIHRDLKPSNVMVGDGGHVTVLDFGLARLAEREGKAPEETLTSPGMVLGSCPYMAPEQALGKPVTPASDIFSCGTVLYEAVSGRRAFDGPTPMLVLQAVARSEYPPLEEVAPETPPELQAVVEKCLQQDPGRRYGSGAELAGDLAIFQGTDEVSLAEVPTLTLSTGKLQAVTSRRRRIAQRTALVAAATMLIGIAAGALIARHRVEPLRPDPGRWEVRELLETVGSLRSPAWSPSGDELIVARGQVGRSEILAVNAETGIPRVLLESQSPETLGRTLPSPDGKALLVSVILAGEPALRVVPAVGGQATVELINADEGTWIDNDTVIFSREEGGSGPGLYRYSLSRREATRVRGSEEDRAWCRAEPRPGGGYALLAGPANMPDSLYVVGEIGASPQRWLPPGSELFGIDWTPHGRSLVASMDGRLMRVDAEGAVPIIPRLDRLWYPAFSAGGDRLAAIRRSSTNDLIGVDPDGNGWSCLLCGVPDSGWGSVDADGVVVYRRYVAGNATLFARERSGVEEALTYPVEDASCPSISPDGGRIAYLARGSEGSPELRVVSRSGGQPVTLASGVESSEYPSWSPDGRFLTYAAGSPLQVWAVSAAGGEPRLLTPEGGDYPQWQPGGSYIAYSVWTEDTDPNQGAWVVPAEGGTPRMIGREPTRMVWNVNGDRLWQLRRADNKIELWEAVPGIWEWRRRSVLDIGRPANTHLEHLPLTVNPESGELVMNRRTANASLLVFEGLDPKRW